MIALSLAGIALISLLAQWLAWSVRVPAILFLLLSGLLLGPVTGLLDPDQLLGICCFPLVSLSVAIILFEGALTLHLTELKGIGKVVRNLCSTGMVTSFAVIGAASYFLLGLDWRVAMVLGAVLVVTGPTVIAPMLNVIRPVREVDKILRWEGIVIDPIGALFAVLVFEAVRLGSQGIWSVIPCWPWPRRWEWGRSSGSVPAGSPPCSSARTGCRSACTSSGYWRWCW